MQEPDEEILELEDGREFVRSAARASEPAFARIWNDPEDDAYDFL